ncbi:hypothetical protein SNE40_017195 [Patella caerulea]|uniref:C2H2-type domain-containing protein n=1 Tax=Patella caerulea TaxID=87958 RepID=A0AAN8JBI6_PATCE
MTSTCEMNQEVQTHLIISQIDVNRIIQTCDSLVNNQNITVNQLISLFCKISGCDSYCEQIVSLCNQILSDTVTSSNDIVNVCKSLKHIDLSLDEPDTYLVIEHDEDPGSLTSVEPSNQIAKETFLCQNNVSPSILKTPLERSKHKPSLLQISKPQITIATSKPNITIPTSQPESPILTNSPELHIVTSQPELPKDTSHPEIIIETGQPELPIDTSHPEIIIEIGQPELLVPIATSQPKPSKPNNIETSQPELPIETSQSKSSILTRSKSNITIATNEPDIPTSTSNSESTSKHMLPITISKSESLKIINNPQLHPPSCQGKLPLATSLLKSPIATSKPEILKATSKSTAAFLKSTSPKCNTVTIYPKSFVAACTSELPIVTNKSEFTIATSSNRNNSKSSTIVQTLKNATDSETIKAIDNLIQNNANLLQSNLVSKRKPLPPKSKHKHKVFSSERRPKPCERFICNICEKIFTRGSLRKHKLTHLDHKPVACPQCDYRCVSQSYLTTHLQRHNREKNYQCEKCGKFFKRTANLRRHKLTHSVTKKEIAL